MAEPLRITVPSSTADINPFADPEGSPFYDPVELNPRSRDLVIRTIFGEAGDKDEAGRAAVANVIRNRVASGRSKQYGEGVEGVITKRNAFEPWWNATARERMRGLREDDPNYQAIAKIADDIFRGTVEDTTQGATHFYSPSGQAAMRRIDNRKLVPDWARGQPLANIGGHLFYAPEGAVRGTPSSPAPGRGGAATTTPSPAPPTIPDDERVQLASLSQAQNVAPAPAANPFITTTPPQAAQPTATPKQPLPPAMQTGDVGQGTAFGQGAWQGATFGFGDELQGMEAALGTSIPGGAGERLLTAINIAKQAWGSYQANPNDAAMAAYTKAVAEARRLYAQSKQQYPGTTLAGEVAGGAAVPLPGGPLTSAGRTVASRVGSGIMQGSIAGGLTGAGSAEGDISQRIGPALTGAAGGAVVGAGVAGAAPTFANYIGGALLDAARPAARAVRKVANLAVDAGRTAEKGRVLPGQMTPETMVADLLGEPGRGAARAVHNMSDVASSIVKDATEVRASGQYRRFMDWLESKFGPLGDNEMARLAVKAEQAQVTRPLYQGAYDQFPRGVVTQRLVGLLQGHQRMQEVGQKALREIGDNAAVQNRPSPGVDSLEFWDAAKRVIDADIRGAKARPDGANDFAALTELKRVLLNEIDSVTGGPQGPYANARAVASEYFGIDRAIKEGQRFIKVDAFKAPQAENAMRGMGPDAQEAFRKAALSQLLDKYAKPGDSHNLWKGIHNSPDAQAKLNFLFNGDQKLIAEFEAMKHVENLHERLREAVRGNSTTVKQYLTAAALGGTGVPIGYLTGNMSLDPTTGSGAAAWSGAALGARRFANQRMAEHLATMLVSRDPDLIQQAVKAASGDVRMMNLLRTMVENVSSRTGGAAVGRSIGD